MSLFRYFHTLRYLKPVQIYGRLWNRFNPAKPDLRPAPKPRLISGLWFEAAARPIALLDNESFCFLNQVGYLNVASDWNNPLQEKLWLYNLHYFDDLNALKAESRVTQHRALIARWIIENPSGFGNGWEPYPTSLRLINWFKWALKGNHLESAWLESLAVQTRWLRQHIEWHLLGNHLFVNAKALIFAGLFFEGDEANEWLAKGLQILAREIPEQVLTDGGHFELSPMYHAIILEDLLDLVNITNVWPEQIPETLILQWRNAAAQMLVWLAGLCHADGQFAFFNDTALGIAPDLKSLTAYAKRLGISNTGLIMPDKRCTFFAATGYVRLQQGDALALLDVAQIGPSYLPGHAHADTLSFELSLFGQRVVVNSGISQYGLGKERLRQRGTAAHSTVEVNGVDSSEVWSGFRVARRAQPFDLSIAEEDFSVTVTCSHDGYRRLPGKPVHRRVWQLTDHALLIRDFIEGDFISAVARFYLHPSVTVSVAGVAAQLQLPNGQVMRWLVRGGSASVVAATWHPEFGQSIPNSCIEVFFTAPEASLEFSWN